MGDLTFRGPPDRVGTSSGTAPPDWKSGASTPSRTGGRPEGRPLHWNWERRAVREGDGKRRSFIFFALTQHSRAGLNCDAPTALGDLGWLSTTGQTLVLS